MTTFLCRVRWSVDLWFQWWLCLGLTMGPTDPDPHPQPDIPPGPSPALCSCPGPCLTPDPLTGHWLPSPLCPGPALSPQTCLGMKCLFQKSAGLCMHICVFMNPPHQKPISTYYKDCNDVLCSFLFNKVPLSSIRVQIRF